MTCRQKSDNNKQQCLILRPCMSVCMQVADRDREEWMRTAAHRTRVFAQQFICTVRLQYVIFVPNETTVSQKNVPP